MTRRPGVRLRRHTMATAVVSVLAAGCGGGPAPGVDVPPSPEPSPEVTTSPTGPPAPENEVVRTTGKVVAGVEPGCVLLDNGEVRYLLLGDGDDQLVPGRRVTVTGVADPGTPSTCMEGIPLRVTEVKPLPPTHDRPAHGWPDRHRDVKGDNHAG